MAPWAFVAPASRGIGFHLTRHLLRNTTLPVVATARNNNGRDFKSLKSSILEGLKDVNSKRLTLLNLDVTDESTIQNAAEETKSLFPPKDNHLHLSFCIPGVLYPEKSPAQLVHDQLTHTFAVNTIGPLLLFKHFSPFLPKKSTSLSIPSSLPQHAVWLNMAARVGSTSDNKLGGWYSYRASKAAVISASKGEDIFVKGKSGENAMVMAYHPGTVKTDFSEQFWGGVPEGKLFGVQDAVEKMVGVVNSVGLKGRGRCWDWKGEEVLP